MSVQRTFAAVCLFLFSLVSAAGTYEYRLRNAMSGLSFPSLQSEPAAQLTTYPDWHVSVFQRPSALAASDYVSIPIMAAPVCLAYNLSKPATFEVTLAGLGALLLGTANPSAVSLTTAGSLTAVLASQVVFVLAPPSTSPSSALLLANLVSNGVTGFTSKAAWPAALSTNPLVAMVADEAALTATLASTSGAMGPLPLAAGSGLPCSRVRVVTSTLTLETASYTPYLPSSTTMNHLTVSSSEPVSVTSTGAAYPLVGALVLSVRVQAACSASAEAQAFGVRVFTDTGFIASLLPWGFAPLLNDDALVATRTMILGTCGNYTRVVAGGSSAITTAVAGWVLKYLSETLYFVDYRPDGSGTGLVGAETGTHAIAASDSLFTAAQFAQYPNIRFAPALAWAVSLVFNLDGFSTVSLPRCALLPIFNGTIKYWDDPLIQRANPAAVLPHTPISVVARTGTSGTTEVFTGGLAQLDAACNGGLNASVARSNAWKLPYQLAAGSTGGIVSAVQKTVGAIGYVAAPSARSQLMAEATIVDEKTNAGTTTSNNFVSAALATSVLDPVTNELTFKVSGTAYPFVGVTYYVIDANRKGNCTPATIGLHFANWTVSQAEAVTIASSATFVTLNDQLVTITESVISSVVCDSKALFPLPPSPAAEAVSSGLVAVIVIIVAACIVLVAAVLVASRRGGRDLSHAPKDVTKPFGMVFTDIESSTSQWALSPVEMGPALDQHHDIMRLLIKKHKGYEVKTIGDCFMVAFKEAADAVSFGLDVQNAFYDAEWNPIFDINYRELKSVALEEAASAAKAGGKSLNLTNELALRAQLRSENYDRLWHGLRIRVGVHFAVGEPKLDEVTQAYDYYGTVVNTAARVESVSHGGQLCVTYEAFNAIQPLMSTVFADTVVTDLDEVELRGLTEPVHLFQILPSRLKDRAFPPLRLDKAEDIDTDELTEEPSGSTAAGGADTMSHRSSASTMDTRNNASELAKYLTRGMPETRTLMLTFAFDYTVALLSTMKPDERKKQVAALRKNWRINADPRLRGFESSMGPEKFGLMILAHRVAGTLNIKSLVIMKEGSQGSFSQSNSNRFRGATMRNLTASSNANPNASLRYRATSKSPESKSLSIEHNVEMEDIDHMAGSGLLHHVPLSPSSRATADALHHQ